MTSGIRAADLDHGSVRALLDLHFRDMHEHSPAGSCFVLDLSGLKRPDIEAWVFWQDDQALGMGALRRLSPGHGEIKSMRTRPDALGRGIAAALLAHIVEEARARGLRRLSLETGSGPAFEAALSLYLSRGFIEGGPFADYRPSPFNRFLHLAL